ncbi:MAG TPA: copper homeostasis protein CutC [Bacteroidia bacterium]|nr:copper homeostasis protein CutC [Bacteroidia bacterium]
MSPTKILELACFNLDSVLIAERAGADRIELCENYKEGGTTPSKNLILAARKACTLPLHVLVRPRGGNFVYSADELEQMKTAILFCKQNGINGVVLGVLDQKNEVNLNACRELIGIARPMSLTFHRAIDECADLKRSFADLLVLGLDRVLSSGGTDQASKGAARLAELQTAYGKKIKIIAGGGLRSGNMAQLLATGCAEFHSSAITANNELADEAEIQKLKSLLNDAP